MSHSRPSRSRAGEEASSTVQRILTATDRSETADRAVAWAAEMAERYGAELVLVQVVAPPNPDAEQVPSDDVLAELSRFAERVAGPRGRARVLADPDPAQAICSAADEEGADVVVVGGVGMSGRKEFLLGNVPNRVSHNAGCTVVIVNTVRGEKRRLGGLLGRGQ